MERHSSYKILPVAALFLRQTGTLSQDQPSFTGQLFILFNRLFNHINRSLSRTEERISNWVEKHFQQLAVTETHLKIGMPDFRSKAKQRAMNTTCDHCNTHKSWSSISKTIMEIQNSFI